MENIKIRIKSRAHSAEVQNELFRLGCRWPVTGTSIAHNASFLFTDQYGTLRHSNITKVFENSPSKEATLESLRAKKWKNLVDQCFAGVTSNPANITVINQLMSSLTREIMKHTENSENLKELRLAVAALSAIYELQIEINYNQ